MANLKTSGRKPCTERLKEGRYYRFQHPPVRATRKRASAFDIHDDVTHGEERLRREWLGEEISQ
eukprot:2055410-Pleurochrysis_carterae.AAC.1